MNDLGEAAEQHRADNRHAQRDHRQCNGSVVRLPVSRSGGSDQSGHLRRYRHELQTDGGNDRAHDGGRKDNIDPARSGVPDD
ncbi:hypothetical protein D3C71_1411540 [compost metagenome]